VLAKARKIKVADLMQMIVQSTASHWPYKEKSMKMFQVLHDGTKMPIGPFKATTMYARDPYPPTTPPYFEIHFGGTLDKSVRYKLEMDRLELIHFVQDQLATLLMSQGEISATVLRDKIDEALFYHLGIRDQEEAPARQARYLPQWWGVKALRADGGWTWYANIRHSDEAAIEIADHYNRYARDNDHKRFVAEPIGPNEDY
jgi:hypothetical protein